MRAEWVRDRDIPLCAVSDEELGDQVLGLWRDVFQLWYPQVVLAAEAPSHGPVARAAVERRLPTREQHVGHHAHAPHVRHGGGLAAVHHLRGHVLCRGNIVRTRTRPHHHNKGRCFIMLRLVWSDIRSQVLH